MDKQIKIKRFDNYDKCDEYDQYIWTPNCYFGINIRQELPYSQYHIYNDGVYTGVSFKTMELADEYVRNKFAEFIKSYITIDTVELTANGWTELVPGITQHKGDK